MQTDKPASFNREQADTALHRIANGQVPSEFCCRYTQTVPDSAADIEHWAAADPTGFGEALREAKRLGAKAMIAECLTIAKDRQYRVDERKLMIETRKHLAALWDADCNPKQVVEQTSVHKFQTPRETFIADAMTMLGMSREAAERQYDGRPMLTVVNG